MLLYSAIACRYSNMHQASLFKRCTLKELSHKLFSFAQFPMMEIGLINKMSSLSRIKSCMLSSEQGRALFLQGMELFCLKYLTPNRFLLRTRYLLCRSGDLRGCLDRIAFLCSKHSFSLSNTFEKKNESLEKFELI